MPQLSLAAATALIDAVSPQVDGHLLGLHWPNDLYVGGRKLAGILVDVLGDGRHLLGVGLNTNCSADTAPTELSDSIATLAHLTGRMVDHSQLLESFLERLAENLRMLAESPERIGHRFNDLCLQHGQLLTVRTGDTSVTGRCAGIAVDGALLLDLPSGRRAIYSGTLC
jgi:BirA family biotin operon repressor/biotin-[acetyl-CoA-carboxylase] ligase